MFQKIFIGVLLVLNVVLVFRIYTINNDNLVVSTVSAATAQKNKGLMGQLLKSEMNNLASMEAAQITIPAGDSILKHQDCIFFRISGNNCSLCIYESLKVLNKYLIQLKRPVIVLADYPSIQAAKKSYNIPYKIILTPKFPADSLVNKEKPYFFTLSKSGKMERVFFPEYDMINEIDGYMRYILKKI